MLLTYAPKEHRSWKTYIESQRERESETIVPAQATDMPKNGN